MVFLNFWKGEKNHYKEQTSQLALSGNSQALTPKRHRVDGAIVTRRFNRAIKDNGGAGDVYRDSAISQTQELFDCNVDELYRETEGKRNDRSSLPRQRRKHTWLTSR